MAQPDKKKNPIPWASEDDKFKAFAEAWEHSGATRNLLMRWQDIDSSKSMGQEEEGGASTTCVAWDDGADSAVIDSVSQAGTQEQCESHTSQAGPGSPSGLELEAEEQEALEYLQAFPTGPQQDEAQKLRFFASIHTLCRAKGMGSSVADSCGLLKKLVVLLEEESHGRLDSVVRQQAMLAVAAMSKEWPFLMHTQDNRLLSSCINSIFCLPPQERMESIDASLYAQTMEALDEMLKVLAFESQASSLHQLQNILQMLLPFTASPKEAERRRAVGRIVRLSRLLDSSSLLEKWLSHGGSSVKPFLFRKRPLDFLGQLMGHLTLCCAEDDQEISHSAAEALHHFYRIILLRKSSKRAAENLALPEMNWQEEAPNTFWPSKATDESTEFGIFLFPSERTDFLLTVIEGITDPRLCNTEVVEHMMEAVLRDPSSELDRVPQVISSLHKKLLDISEVSLEAILKRSLFQMACLEPGQVVEALLNTSLVCDSAARRMWRMLVSKQCPAEEVLKELLSWLRDRPLLRRDTSCSPGDSYILPLTATRVLNEILQEPSSKVPVQLISPQLYLAVLFQLHFILECTQEDLQDYCQMCRQADESPPVSPVRSAVQALKALLCCADCDHLADSMEMQGAWDMLMSMETYPAGVALLTRELWMNAADQCAWMFENVITVLSCGDRHREIAAMAIFLELLNCTDFEQEIDEDCLDFLQRHLHNQRLVMREMVITGLATLSERRQIARSLQGLVPALLEHLQAADSSFRSKALTIFSHMLHLLDWKMASAMGLQLAEELPPLFDDEAALVRELSIQLFQNVMAIVVGKDKVLLKKHVHSCLLPLLVHVHEEIPSVAQASREALLGVAQFLKWKQLRQLLETAQIWQIGEWLLASNRSRANEYLQQSLAYLESPHESSREAAVRFLGLLGKRMKDPSGEKLQDIFEALQRVAGDSSPFVRSLAVQTTLILRASGQKAPSAFSLRALCGCLRRA